MYRKAPEAGYETAEEDLETFRRIMETLEYA